MERNLIVQQKVAQAGQAKFDYVKKGKNQLLLFKNTMLRERLLAERSEPEYHSGYQYQAKLMHTVLCRTQTRMWQNWESSDSEIFRSIGFLYLVVEKANNWYSVMDFGKF